MRRNKASAQSCRNEAGFALVEVLSALVIFAVAAIAFLQISSGAADQTRQAKAADRAFVFAQHLLDEQVQKRAYSADPFSGYDERAGFFWSVQSERLERYRSTQSEQPSIMRVSVRVGMSETPAPKDIELTVLTALGL